MGRQVRVQGVGPLALCCSDAARVRRAAGCPLTSASLAALVWRGASACEGVCWRWGAIPASVHLPGCQPLCFAEDGVLRMPTLAAGPTEQVQRQWR